MLASATGREPDHIIGKPYHYMFDTFCRNFDITTDEQKKKCLMIGDKLATDI